MNNYTFTWKASFPFKYKNIRNCRWSIHCVETYLKFLVPSERAPFTFFGCNPHNFRLLCNGRLIARSATYSGV